MGRPGSRPRLLVGVAAAALALPAGAGADGEPDPGFGTDGSVVTSFGSGTGVDGTAAVILEADGAIVTAGIAAGNGFGLSRLLPNGAPDTSYGRVFEQPLGPAPAFNTATGAAPGPGGGVTVAGAGGGSAAAPFDTLALRFTAAGDLDPSFGNDPPNPVGDGVVQLDIGSEDVAAGVAVDPAGRTLLAGRTGTNFAGMANDLYVSRLGADGAPDPSWDGDGTVILNPGVDDSASDVVVEPGGRVLVAARLDAAYAVLGFTDGGALDSGFGGGDGIATIPGLGSAIATESRIERQPDGRIVVARATGAGGQEPVFAVGRLLADGSPDPSFAGGGTAAYDVGPDASLGDLAVADDGRIVLVGSASAGDDRQIVVLRLRPDGGPDPAFGAAGVLLVGAPEVREDGEAVAIQPDRRIVIGGSRFVPSVSNDRLVTRLLGDTRPPNTKITKKPRRKVAARKRRRFEFVVRGDVNSTFECKLRRRQRGGSKPRPGRARVFAPCRSPLRTKRLRPGRYVFRVRAIDPAGNTDPTPAKRRLRAIR